MALNRSATNRRGLRVNLRNLGLRKGKGFSVLAMLSTATPPPPPPRRVKNVALTSSPRWVGVAMQAAMRGPIPCRAPAREKRGRENIQEIDSRVRRSEYRNDRIDV